jgi:hypothetical protein
MVMDWDDGRSNRGNKIAVVTFRKPLLGSEMQGLPPLRELFGEWAEGAVRKILEAEIAVELE